MQSVYYWSPCLNKVGTYKSTINSAISLAKYSKNNYAVKVINTCGEWGSQKKLFKENNIEVLNFGYNYFQFLPKKGFFGSRLSFIIIILFSIIPLFRLLARDKPDFIILHLITSLPLILLKIFNFKTKFILRFSGYPKLNFHRKFLWKLVSKKILKVTCPSLDLIDQLKKYKIFSDEKLFFLPDAIINIKDYVKQINYKVNRSEEKHKEKYFIAAGRLTKQKNFNYLIDEFYEFSKNNFDSDLLIFGDGEEKENLTKKIINYDLSNRVFLMGHSENVYSYMKKAYAFILSSLWEDPGFVIIEAAMSNLFVISSNCKNGPKEFLQNGKAGLLFESNKKEQLKDKLKEFEKLKKEEIKLKKIEAKKNCVKYTMFRHSLYLRNII